MHARAHVCVCLGWLCASLDKAQVKAPWQGRLPRGRQFGGHAGWGCHQEVRSRTGRQEQEVVTTTQGRRRPRARAWTPKALMLLRPWEYTWRQQVTPRHLNQFTLPSRPGGSQRGPASRPRASAWGAPWPGSPSPHAPLLRGCPDGRWQQAPGPLSPHSLSLSSHMESPMNTREFPVS